MLIANISCERSILMIITTMQRPSNVLIAKRTCSQTRACNPYNLCGDQALLSCMLYKCKTFQEFWYDTGEKYTIRFLLKSKDIIASIFRREDTSILGHTGCSSIWGLLFQLKFLNQVEEFARNSAWTGLRNLPGIPEPGRIWQQFSSQLAFLANLCLISFSKNNFWLN